MSRLTSSPFRTALLKAKSRPKVSLPQGIYYGTMLSSPTHPLLQPIEQFLGIPYAEIPFRFAAPAPLIVTDHKHHDDHSQQLYLQQEFDATSYGPRCPAGWGDQNYSEDCLRVNVFRPVLSPDEGRKLLPVVVYFHGGGFNSGYGHLRDMASFISHSGEPIVGVSFNYRTGIFGFLPVRVEGVLNVGLRDQVLLLRWVKENIERFGGDSRNVTVMGSSAGAHSIGHLLMIRKEEEGEGELFQKAIMESGGATARACYPFNHPLHVQQLENFLKSLGCEGLKTEEETIKKLREIDMEILKKASDALFEKYNPSLQWPFQPVIDGPGGIIPQSPIKSFHEEKYRKIPILTGFNTNEGAMFIRPSISTSEEFTSFFRTLIPALTEQDLSRLNILYPDPLTTPSSPYRETRKGLGAQFKRTEQAYGHYAYISPVRQTVQYLSRESSVYLYHFAASCSVNGGADHGTQSPFVVHAKDVRLFSESVAEISGVMNACWASFVVEGDPNAVRGGRFGGRAAWKKFVGEDGVVVVFGEGNDEVAGSGERGVVMQVRKDEWAREASTFWWEVLGRGAS